MAGCGTWHTWVTERAGQGQGEAEAKLPGKPFKDTWACHQNPLCNPFPSGLPLSRSSNFLVDFLKPFPLAVVHYNQHVRWPFFTAAKRVVVSTPVGCPFTIHVLSSFSRRNALQGPESQQTCLKAALEIQP